MTNKRNMSERVEWSELPESLLPTIGERLDTRIDNLRFRSVCTSWRSSTPPFDSVPPRRFPRYLPNPFPFPLPEPIDSADAVYKAWLTVFERKFTLRQSILYRLQRLHPSPSDKAWLIKVEGRKMCLFDPLSTRRERYELPNNFNLLDFQHLELTRACSLEVDPYLDEYVFVYKAVMYPNSPSINLKDSHVFVIYVIHDKGELAHAKCGDESWTYVGKENEFNDVIVYEGRFYVVDRSGIVYRINVSSLELQQLYPQIPDGELGKMKYLVESGGALYVVDKYCEGRVRFKVFKLNKESDGSFVWDLMESLGDRAFILGCGYSLSVSAGESFGYKGNCIYFTQYNQAHVFKLEDDSIANLDI